MAARKPIEQKRATARSATKDSAGRPLPATAELISLPGCGGEPPAYPSTLVEDGRGRARWDQIWRDAGDWISPDVDIAVVTRLCELEDMRTAYKLQVELDGIMVLGSTGQPTRHPLIPEIRQLDDQMTKYEAHLGLTPQSRSALNVAEVDRTSGGVVGQVAAIMAAQSGVNAKRGQ